MEPGDGRLENDGVISILTQLDGRTGMSDRFQVNMGEDMENMDMGCVQAGSLGDLVWLDVNGNGLQDWDEHGISGVTVHLSRDGKEVAQTVTDQYGFFTFGDLYPAVYTLSADTGLTPTRQETLTGINSVAGGQVQAKSGTHNYDADLGYLPSAPGVYPEGYGQGEAQNWQQKAE